jgi:hypothetical protein
MMSVHRCKIPNEICRLLSIPYSFRWKNNLIGTKIRASRSIIDAKLTGEIAIILSHAKSSCPTVRFTHIYCWQIRQTLIPHYWPLCRVGSPLIWYSLLGYLTRLFQLHRFGRIKTEHDYKLRISKPEIVEYLQVIRQTVEVYENF